MEKADLNLDVAALAEVDAGVLSALRVGQRLLLQHQEGQPGPSFYSESGVLLAPLADQQVAARFPHARVIVRAIKREPGSGAIQHLQVRVYRADDTASGPPSTAPGPSAPTSAPAGAGAGGDGAGADEAEYQLRRAQYEAMADSAELRTVLADPRLQGVLSRIDGAPNREQALAAQLENPDFQEFVSKVLVCLDPNRVPATAATAAAVAMATR
ncbi:hypothetical protein HYH03_003774 [Edaphochlamys debaryana]|uniref:Zinc finger HIT domain-containing protein n=1 Tax=Edaphochlamys debaryana TaxID=47281 RepID=A0A836C448_9CHLO|nr:hypothetical protein HYH03_003774 [Edaphochlamys debaryana]|eukprot:KAG2498523.1 hypothetical protein HYH03_003774 [Edaphochlamys debaryana]